MMESINRRQGLAIMVTLPVCALLRPVERVLGGWFKHDGTDGTKAMKLQPPQTNGQIALEACIKGRRTVRSFSPDPLTGQQFAQLLWAAQGITDDGGIKRAAPSAGALYPLDLYAVLGDAGVEGFQAGVYHYNPGPHAVSLIAKGDLRGEIARHSLSQMWMASPPLTLVITAAYDRITPKYGRRGIRYAMIEAGHVGQNLFLQAQALGLSAGIVGAFKDQAIIQTLHIPPSQEPLLIMPVGHQKE